MKKLLQDECTYQLPDELMDEFMNSLTEVRLKPKEILVPYGRIDDNIYVVRSGIIRYYYFNGDREDTFAFAAPGTVSILYYCYYMRQPSVFQFESCGESVVMKISKDKLEEMIARSHEFSRWVISLALHQLCGNEMKLSLINGKAKERFMGLVQNRPEIMTRVPLNVIASYLSIVPQYLSRLRKAYFKKSDCDSTK